MPKNPAVLIALILLIVLLFGSSKLPDLARNLGRSMRIVKKEVREMKAEDESAASAAQAPPAVTSSAPSVDPSPAAPSTPAVPSTPAEQAGDDTPQA